MEEPDSLVHKRAILEYWTLVEFFSPYPLENTLNSKQHYQKIYADKPAGQPLPWQNATPIPKEDSATPFAKGYHLYLGLFSTEETADRARHAFANQPSQWQSVNWRSCAAPGSTTCFARLTITTHGTPLFGTLSLSTLPWAHGRLLNEGKQLLTIEQYWKSVNRLLLRLREEFAANLPTRLVKEPKEHAPYLDLDTLSELTELLFEWAGYKPHGYPLALIEPISGDNTVAAKEPKIETERDLPILNSFYIQDLEAAAVSLNTQKGKPIDYYLGGKQEKRILLESEEGAKMVLNTVRPELLPAGRWPDPPSHQQSLMQQFSISASLKSLKGGGLFSVNGPPGTGKTSLLREIIAENMVVRARALTQFKTAQEAFTGRCALGFKDSDSIFVSELNPSLLGHEMLVVSSNNAAVQNLSHELPLRSQLDPSYRYASYLETVATKALGTGEKQAWGLISAALGNIANCRSFVEKVFMTRDKVEGGARIWEWVDEYDGPSFREAKENFIAIENRQTQLSEKLEELAFLHAEIYGYTVGTYCAEAFGALENVEEECNRLELKLTHILQEEQEAKELLALLEQRVVLWKQERPNPLRRIVDRKASAAWSEKSSFYTKDCIAALEELHRCKSRKKELETQFKQLCGKRDSRTKKLLDRALIFHAYQETYQALKEVHPTSRLPNSYKELEELNAHKQPYYQTEIMNGARSELFIAAMTLHEAWLSETLRVKGGFRGNLMAIANVIQGKCPTTADDTRLAWQSVFLLIPVLSSTFASVGRLFRYLEPETLGWLLIDEAGQALPQAAVGAIWRAKRVLSIGDPFQIEPISTVPAEVIDGMAKSKLVDNFLQFAPSQISVQTLMDRASIYGSKRTIREESYWLGSPLRVHRRCLDPMFTIANSIAYENSMLLATKQNKEIPLPPSCWWDIGGHVSDRQYVPEQGKALIRLLQNAFEVVNSPDFFVISPFREVVTQIQHLIFQDQVIGELFKEKFPNTPLQSWIRQAVGTVHSFQGKQAAAVFFVLGADRTTLGAIEWATRKPNLLNVAVTRAQSRFYLIGDYDLWQSFPFFELAAKKLERCKLPNTQMP